MKRLSTTAALAFGCIVLAPSTFAQSHDTENRIKTTTEHGRLVTYTGCVATNEQVRDYMLTNVVPTQPTTERFHGSTTTTTYALIPEASVQLEPQIGHRVEVQAVLVKPGRGTATVKNKTEVNGKDTKTETDIKRRPYQQLRVISFTPLGGSCTVTKSSLFVR